MDKLYEDLCQNLQKSIFLAEPLLLKQLFYLNQSRCINLLYMSAFKKCVSFFCTVSISRVIPIYKWDIFIGTCTPYILDPVGRNFARKVHARLQKVFIRKVSLRLYAKCTFFACFEVHIPVACN